MAHIPYGRQDVTAADVAAVDAVLASDWLTQGPAVPRFEHAIAQACGVRHAVAVSSATAALHLACLALDLGPGDLLWTSPITFVASANAARYCGADVDFVDVDARSGNLSPAALRRKLEAARTTGRLPKIVVPVHLAGQSCDMVAIRALGREFGFRIIEDASHAIGGRFEDAPVGDCRYCDITVFSFHPVKIITSAEGGMAVTQDDALAARLTLLRSHGITREAAQMSRASDGPWYYEQATLGYNYRMTDLQAALGASQAQRLVAYVTRRTELAQRYDTLLESLPLERPWQDPRTQSAWHLYVVRVDAARRRAVFEALRVADIGVNVHYIPVHTQPYYREHLAARGVHCDCPEAERYYAECISLPMYATLRDADQDHVVHTLAVALAA